MPSTLSKAVVASALLGAVDASRDTIAGYSPGSKVTSHNAIDLDVAAMVELLKTKDFAGAKDIYEQGGNSKPYAEITLASGLAAAAEKGDKVTAKDAGDNDITMSFYADTAKDETTIKLAYPISDSQDSYAGCKVGALKEKTGSGILEPFKYTAACLNAVPSLAIEGGAGLGAVTAIVNKAGRHLDGFSTKAYGLMYQLPPGGCGKRATDGCPYVEYKKFYDYYGDNYASIMVKAALDGGKTDFTDNGGTAMPLGEMDFTGEDGGLRVQVAKKTAVYMSAYMYAVREFEDAIDDCKGGCNVVSLGGVNYQADGNTNPGNTDCNEHSTDSVHAWDEGVAFYTGTLEGAEKGGNKNGEMSYRLAEKRCGNFKTCGDYSDELTGTSYVNTKLFKLIDQGQVKLLMGQCDAVKPIVDEMTALMSVPLIQGTLRYAHKLEYKAAGAVERGEGAAFAASIVPAVHACDAAAAKEIMDIMKVGTTATLKGSFIKVKKAFEKCYKPMMIKCEEVGGLWDEKAEPQAYAVDAAPCARDPDNSVPQRVVEAAAKEVVPTWGVAVIAVVAALFGITIIGFCVLVMKERAGTPIFLKLEKGGSKA